MLSFPDASWQLTSEKRRRRELSSTAGLGNPGSFRRLKTARVPAAQVLSRCWADRRDVAAPIKSSQDAELCNSVWDKTLAGGCAQGGGKAGLAPAERHTERRRRRRREACALPSTRPFCSGVTHSSSCPATARCRRDALVEQRRRAESAFTAPVTRHRGAAGTCARLPPRSGGAAPRRKLRLADRKSEIQCGFFFLSLSESGGG